MEIIIPKEYGNDVPYITSVKDMFQPLERSESGLFTVTIRNPYVNKGTARLNTFSVSVCRNGSFTLFTDVSLAFCPKYGCLATFETTPPPEVETLRQACAVRIMGGEVSPSLDAALHVCDTWHLQPVKCPSCFTVFRRSQLADASTYVMPAPKFAELITGYIEDLQHNCSVIYHRPKSAKALLESRAKYAPQHNRNSFDKKAHSASLAEARDTNVVLLTCRKMESLMREQDLKSIILGILRA